MPTERQQRFLISTLLMWSGTGCALLSIGLLVLSVTPYEFCASLARLATGSENPLSQAQHSLLLPRLLPSGLFYGMIGISLLLFRRQLMVWLTQGMQSLLAYASRGVTVIVGTLRTETRWHLASLALIMLLATALRVKYLHEPPRYDESSTYLTFAGRSIVHVLTQYPAPNNHILYSLFVWFSCRIFGDSPWAMRIPALIAGVVLIPLIYATSRKFGGRNAAIYAAGFAAVSGPFVLYSVNARGYMFQAVFLVVMLYLAVELATEAPLGAWILFSAAAVAGFWTSPTMLYSYLIAAGWLLWESRGKVLGPLLLSGGVTVVLVIALYMPVMIVSGPAQLLANPWVQPLTGQEFRVEARRFPAELLDFLHGGDPPLMPIVLGLGIGLGFFFKPKLGRYGAHLLVVLLLVVFLVSAVLGIVPFPRVLLPLFTVYYLSAALGWSVTDGRIVGHEWPLLIAALALLGATAFHLTRSDYIEAYRDFPESHAVAAFLATELRPCDKLLISESAGAPLKFELYRQGVTYSPNWSAGTLPVRILVATAQLDGPLPSRGNGLLDPSLLTLEGTLRAARVDTDQFVPSQLIYTRGQGEVFELTARRAATSRLPGCPIR